MKKKSKTMVREEMPGGPIFDERLWPQDMSDPEGYGQVEDVKSTNGLVLDHEQVTCLLQALKTTTNRKETEKNLKLTLLLKDKRCGGDQLTIYTPTKTKKKGVFLGKVIIRRTPGGDYQIIFSCFEKKKSSPIKRLMALFKKLLEYAMKTYHQIKEKSSRDVYKGLEINLA